MSGNSAARIRLLLIEDGGGQANRLTELLSDESMELRIASQSVGEALQQVRSVAPEVILVSLPEAMLPPVIEQIDAVSGGSPIVALLTPAQTDASRDILLAGARAILPIDTGRDELVDTVVSVLERERRRRAALARQLGVEIDLGQVIAVHGAKGGVGATSVSVNLAVAIKLATNKRVALVDANLYSGDVAAALHLMSRSSLADLTPHLKELDQEFLERASVRHVSGVRAFLAPDDFVRAQAINGEQITRILKVMRQYFDYIVIDTCSLPDQVTTAALEEANRILLIATPEVPALKNAARFLRLAGEFGYRNRVSVVLNRAKSRGALHHADIESHLHAPIAVAIGSDGRTLPAAINAGEPVIEKRRSKFGAGIWQLAASVTGAHTRKVRSQKSQQVEPAPAERVQALAPLPVRKMNLAGEPAVLANGDAAAEIGGQPRKSLMKRLRSGD